MSERPTFELVPGFGVPPIRFGMTPDEVRSAMGEPGHGVPHVLYFRGSILVNTDDDDRVSYIELARSEKFTTLYKGIAIFEVPPDEAAMFVCGGVPQTETFCADLDADVGMDGLDGDRWVTIGIGPGNYFRKIYEKYLPIWEEEKMRRRDAGIW